MAADLKPYLPRILLEWLLETPDSRCRVIDGTLAFVDISGFTAMSERLARKGKVGAEEVTSVLNETFENLLRVAYEAGGSLIKFGGDALLLFFTGDGHARRACFAATEMRAALRGAARIQTSAGAIGLRMSIGIHTGSFHFFLVGQSHRELILTGDDASQTVLMERTAEAGEIVVSAATAAELEPALLGAPKGEGRLLRKTPGERAEILIPPEVSGAECFVPIAIRMHLLSGGIEPEHRQATVAFLRFEGTDAMLQTRGADGVAQVLEDLVSAVQSEVEQNLICFLGTDIDSDGGKIILVAGAPQATENDEERMLRALRNVADSSFDLPIRIGVHRGHVFAGPVGPDYRRTYTVMGDAVNTAARVMSRAEQGEVLVTNDVLARSSTLFEVDELEPFTVKGKAQQLTASRLGRAVGQRKQIHYSGLPMLGRDKELAAVRSAVASAQAGRGQAVEIIAEAGLGKSRLLEAVKQETQHVTQFLAQCEQYEASTPYFPFRSLLGALIGAGDGADPAERLRAVALESASDLLPYLPLIAIALEVDVGSTPEVEQIDERFRRARLERSVVELLKRLTPDPTIFIFEDVHWMDQPSRSLLGELVRAAETNSWTLLITTRPNYPSVAPEGSAASTLRLTPLGDDDSTALARAASEDSLLPHYASVLAQRGGGNPLFLQALVASAQSSLDLSALPESIESAISAQIDELAPSARSLLRLMAVLGREVDLDLLRSVLEEGSEHELETNLAALAPFVEIEADRATFRQALIRDAAYEGLPMRRRRAVHARVGEMIEKRSTDPEKEAELLALHFDRGGRFEETWRYSVLAVARGWERFAPLVVTQFSRRAIAAGKPIKKPPDAMATMWKELGFAFFKIGQYEEAVSAIKTARSLTEDVATTAWLIFVEGRCREMLGNRAQAVRWYSRGLRFLEDTAPVGQGEEPFTSPPPDYRPISPRVRLIESLANVRHDQGQFLKAVELSHQAVSVAVAVDDKPGLAIAYNLLQRAYTNLRDPARRKYGEMALVTAREVKARWLEASVLNNLAIDTYYEGDWSRALSLYEESRRSFITAGDLVWAAAVSNNIGEILLDQGKLEEAGPCLNDSISTFRAAHFEQLTATLTANLGRLAARRGDFAQAERLFDQSLAALRKLGYPSLEVETSRAEMFVMKGDAQAALAATEEIEPGNDPVLRAALHRVQGNALALLGRTDEAALSLATSLGLARSGGVDFQLALTLQALWVVEGEQRFRQEAEEILGRLGIVWVPELPGLPNGA